jgi:hypothetical protein
VWSLDSDYSASPVLANVEVADSVVLTAMPMF